MILIFYLFPLFHSPVRFKIISFLEESGKELLSPAGGVRMRGMMNGIGRELRHRG